MCIHTEGVRVGLELYSILVQITNYRFITDLTGRYASHFTCMPVFRLKSLNLSLAPGKHSIQHRTSQNLSQHRTHHKHPPALPQPPQPPIGIIRGNLYCKRWRQSRSSWPSAINPWGTLSSPLYRRRVVAGLSATRGVEHKSPVEMTTTCPTYKHGVQPNQPPRVVLAIRRELRH